MSLTKESLAALLNGREYGSEITKAEADEAKAAGLVVVFGYSDDNIEFRGALNDEIGVGENTTLSIDAKGEIPEWENLDRCDEEAVADYFGRKGKGRKIKTVWCRDVYSWTYETDIPHAKFDVMEDGDKYCRGIVFELRELSPMAPATSDADALRAELTEAAETVVIMKGKVDELTANLAEKSGEVERLRMLVAGRRDDARESVTLTVLEIRDLAKFAGITVIDNGTESEKEDEKETEIVIETAPEQGVKDEDGEGEPTHSRFIAYVSDYPEEGVQPLGVGIPSANIHTVSTDADSLTHIQTMAELYSCFTAWNGDARVVGNVRAEDAAKAMQWALSVRAPASPEIDDTARFDWLMNKGSIFWCSSTSRGRHCVAATHKGEEFYGADERAAIDAAIRAEAAGKEVSNA